MCSMEVIEGIQRVVSIPVMAKVRIGHFMEARVLEQLPSEEACGVVVQWLGLSSAARVLVVQCVTPGGSLS